MNIKPEDRAEMEVLKNLIDHLKATLLDHDHAEGDAPAVDVVKIEAGPEEHVEDQMHDALDLPDFDDELDTGENLDEAAVNPDDEEEEDPIDLKQIFRLK